jgi:hypothetical protein
LHHSLLQKRVVEQGFLEFFQDDGQTGSYRLVGLVPTNALEGSCELTNIPPVGARKKAGILDSGLVNHQMVAGVRFELTTFGL